VSKPQKGYQDLHYSTFQVSCNPYQLKNPHNLIYEAQVKNPCTTDLSDGSLFSHGQPSLQLLYQQTPMKYLDYYLASHLIAHSKKAINTNCSTQTISWIIAIVPHTIEACGAGPCKIDFYIDIDVFKFAKYKQFVPVEYRVQSTEYSSTGNVRDQSHTRSACHVLPWSALQLPRSYITLSFTIYNLQLASADSFILSHIQFELRQW